MSWPADGRPRFKAAAVARGLVDDPRPEAVGYVYDRANCHRSVLEVTANDPVTAMARAELEAAILNGDGSHPEELRRATFPHSAASYRRHRCRCPVCSADMTASWLRWDKRQKARRA